jgi:hypothetical protein
MLFGTGLDQGDTMCTHVGAFVMAQQQLYLLVLVLVILGLAVTIGIAMFQDNSSSANRDAVAHDLLNFAARAHEYYRRPAVHNGGGGSYAGLTADAEGLAKVTNLPGGRNGNGIYTIQSAGTATQVVVQGVGTEVLQDGNPVTMRILIREMLADSLYEVQ